MFFFFVMALTSYKVKVALSEYIDRQIQFPRPSNVEPVQIELMAAGNARFMTGNSPVEWKQRRPFAKSHDGNGRPEVERQGPFAKRGTKPNREQGRFKSRFKVEKLNILRVRLKIAFNTDMVRGTRSESNVA